MDGAQAGLLLLLVQGVGSSQKLRQGQHLPSSQEGSHLAILHSHSGVTAWAAPMAGGESLPRAAFKGQPGSKAQKPGWTLERFGASCYRSQVCEDQGLPMPSHSKFVAQTSWLCSGWNPQQLAER